MTEVEKYLYRFYQLERLKCAANNDLALAVSDYEEKAEALLKPFDISGAKSAKTNRISNPVQDVAIKMAEVFQKEINKARVALEKVIFEQETISETVEKAELNTVEKSYIIGRYFKGKRSWQTAQSLQYSDRQANRYRTSALRKISGVLEDGR